MVVSYCILATVLHTIILNIILASQKKEKKINNGILKIVTQFTIDNLFKVVSFQVTYNTLLRARSRYGSLDEVQQCLSVYQDMRRAGYDSIK